VVPVADRKAADDVDDAPDDAAPQLLEVIEKTIDGKDSSLLVRSEDGGDAKSGIGLS